MALIAIPATGAAYTESDSQRLPTPPPMTGRLFEGGSEPSVINAQELAMIVNFAIRVGRGTETLKAPGELVAPLGVRRVK
jgi:hypothetical protein